MNQDKPVFKQVGPHAFKRMVYEDSYEDRMADKQEFGRASHDHEITVRNLTNNLDKLSRILTDAQELATLIGKDSSGNPDAAAQAFQGQEADALAAQLKGIYNAFRTGDANPNADASDEYFK
jgi:hypothetical protein